jgi:hypothetical protein
MLLPVRGNLLNLKTCRDTRTPPFARINPLWLHILYPAHYFIQSSVHSCHMDNCENLKPMPDDNKLAMALSVTTMSGFFTDEMA